MTNKKSELHAVEAAEQNPEIVTEEMLDADEAEFARLRRDLPGVKGAGGASDRRTLPWRAAITASGAAADPQGPDRSPS